MTLDGEDVTDSYAASAFDWQRDSGNASADATWNAAHKGKKAITLTAADLSGDVTIACTLTITGEGGGYGSITVDANMDAHHTPGVLDANDTFAIENGHLMVTTARGNVYSLVNGEVHGTGATLNGSITAQSKLFASQSEDVVEFQYDHNGLRTQKKLIKADGTVETTNYTLHGKLVTHLTRGSDTMHFFYDGQNRPSMVEFNGTLHSYVHNLQGDIAGILDSTGSLVVEYKYDAWGKPTLVHTLTTEYEALAELNPFRYRGYVWDTEAALYYLHSRYYNPRLIRFLNGDNVLGGLGNVFSYTRNKPINRKDSDGTYDREAAVEYAHKYHDSWNSEYYEYSGGDCANFVSQCLVAGGIAMNDVWYSVKKAATNFWNFNWLKKLFHPKYEYDWDISESWRLAAPQYEYLKNSGLVRDEITIKPEDDMQKLIEDYNIQIGDIMYFADSDGEPNHAVIITKIEEGMIYYSAHTESRMDQAVSYAFETGTEQLIVLTIYDDAN